MSSEAVPSSVASSRPASKSGITPSEGSVRRPSSTHSYHGGDPHDSQRKRKSEDGLPQAARRPRLSGSILEMGELLKPSIVIKPHPPNPLAKPRTLLPLMLLPREHLPLSCLDLSAPHGEFPQGRFFESRIRIMELEGRLGSNLLIARSDSTASSYAIERQDTGLYNLCKLGSWTNLEKLGFHATALCKQRMDLVHPRKPSTTFEPPLLTPLLHKENKRRQLAIQELQSVVRKRPRSQSVASTAAGAATGTAVDTPQQQSTLSQQPSPTENRSQGQSLTPNPTPEIANSVLANNDQQAEQPTSESIFESIRNQYFEVLYHSMGSLAYFAKGPLSRARAAFHLDCDANLEMGDLIDFLRSLVLTTTLIDKKYRETVPEIVSEMKAYMDSSDEGDASLKKKKRKAKTRKMKPSKDGLYPEEKDHVRKWWKANRPELRDDEVTVKPEETRYHISCLRTRETQLQMILILEILALEIMRPAEDAAESQLPGLESNTPPTKAEAPKKRRKPDLPLLVDVHADRLCIWQSTVLDEVKALAESQVKSNDEHGRPKATTDPLKDFCVDIIKPFFTARLPELCDSLNRKLGGPVSMPPPKPKEVKEVKKPSSATKSRSKPSTTASRPALSKSKDFKSLDRVLSKERLRRSVSRGPNDAIAQLRQATVASIPGLKREMSEPRALTNIPRLESGSLAERPANTLARSSSSLTSAEDARARKKAMLEAELQEAITALKKPNRELAGRAVVEAAEKRLFGGATHIRKARKPVRVPFEKIQVKATPMNNRFRDALAFESHLHGGAAATTHPSLSQESFIPSSSDARQKGNHISSASPRIASTPLADKIRATPSRRLSAVSRRDFLKPSTITEEDEAALASSPLRPEHARAVPPFRLSSTTAVVPAEDEHTPSDFVPTSSPLQCRKAKVAPQSPISMRAAGDEDVSRRRTSSPGTICGNLFETPVKARTSTAAAAVDRTSPAPVAASDKSAPEAGLTIYQRLGWDDEDDTLV